MIGLKIKHGIGSLAIAGLVTAIMATGLSSCGYNAEEAIEKRLKEEDRASVSNFRRVEFEGHDYILYKQPYGPNHTFSGLTHDPDCECFLTKE